MKNTILITAFITLMHTAKAQDKPDLPMCVILNGTANLTTIGKYDYFFSSDANPGFGAGGMFRTDGDFYLLGGIQYVNAKPTLTYYSTSQSEKVTMQLLQIPLMGGMQFVKSADSKKCFHGQMGASFSMLLDVSDNDLGIQEDDLWNTGFTFKAGIGADLWMFVADINYNLLLTHVYDMPGDDNKVRLMCWEFSLGIKIDIGEK